MSGDSSGEIELIQHYMMDLFGKETSLGDYPPPQLPSSFEAPYLEKDGIKPTCIKKGGPNSKNKEREENIKILREKLRKRSNKLLIGDIIKCWPCFKSVLHLHKKITPKSSKQSEVLTFRIQHSAITSRDTPDKLVQEFIASIYWNITPVAPPSDRNPVVASQYSNYLESIEFSVSKNSKYSVFVAKMSPFLVNDSGFREYLGETMKFHFGPENSQLWLIKEFDVFVHHFLVVCENEVLTDAMTNTFLLSCNIPLEAVFISTTLSHDISGEDHTIKLVSVKHGYPKIPASSFHRLPRSFRNKYHPNDVAFYYRLLLVPDGKPPRRSRKVKNV